MNSCGFSRRIFPSGAARAEDRFKLEQRFRTERPESRVLAEGIQNSSRTF